jgi:thioredoxin 1
MTRHIDQSQYEPEILNSPIPVLLDIFGEHCGPCRQLAPVIDRLAIDYDGRVKVLAIDAGANHALAGSLAVSSVPTVVAFHNGKEVGRLVGLRPESAYRKLLESAGV